MKSIRTRSFVVRYRALPLHVQELARKAYRIFAEDPSYPGLQFKCVNTKKRIYSARVGDHYRVLGQMNGDTIEYMPLPKFRADFTFSA